MSNELEYLLPECFMNPGDIDKNILRMRELIVEGAQLNKTELVHYRYMDKTGDITKRLEKLLEECEEQLKLNQMKSCSHDGKFVKAGDDYSCEKCRMLRSLIQKTCSHDWVPAGHRSNRDRVHNKADGKGAYTAYKCSVCSKFKRRYI